MKSLPVDTGGIGSGSGIEKYGTSLPGATMTTDFLSHRTAPSTHALSTNIIRDDPSIAGFLDLEFLSYAQRSQKPTFLYISPIFIVC